MSESTPTKDAWGTGQTRFFFSITPEQVLQAVEGFGEACTGRVWALGSFENRVYEVEVEPRVEDDLTRPEFELRARMEEVLGGRLPSAWSHRRILKFYRPGRWTREQILEEHGFLAELLEADIPVVAPIPGESGATLFETRDGIFFSLFPKVGGRAPEDLTVEQGERIGRMIARMHGVGVSGKHRQRLVLTPETYGKAHLEFLIGKDWIPERLRARYRSIVEEICALSSPLFSDPSIPTHRIHGDCHRGNLLWSELGPFFLDFDDSVTGPAVQDLWLLGPGPRSESASERTVFSAILEGYEQWRPFPRKSLALIEPLRALRFVHFHAWIARRWDDPAFPRAFPQFGTDRYWEEAVQDLDGQLELIRRSPAMEGDSEWV